MQQQPVVPAKQIIAELKKFCENPKFKVLGKYSQKRAAKALGVTAAQLSQTINGRNNVIPARILKKLGYQSMLVYVPTGKTATKKTTIARDASTGRVVSKAAAKKNPAGTTTETITRAVKPAASRDSGIGPEQDDTSVINVRD